MTAESKLDLASSEACATFVDRLLDGADPAHDAELAAHVGSCLACFRVLAEMRDVPRLAAALRRADAPDAGDEAFFAALPGRVFAAVRPAEAAAAPAVAPARARAWLWPASGVLAAAAALAMVVGTSRQKEPVPTAAPVPIAQKTAPTDVGTTTDDAADWALPASVEELDAAGLRALLATIDDASADEESQAFLEALQDETAGLPPLASVAGLDAAALARLSESLKKPI